MPNMLHASRQLVRSIWKKTSRRLLRGALLFASEERKTRAERWLRGREQMQRLRDADIVIVSFGKSGRTWLRVMLSRLYQVKHGLSQRYLLGFDNFATIFTTTEFQIVLRNTLVWVLLARLSAGRLPAAALVAQALHG